MNEATLFRYFSRKADLFWTATESRLNRLKLGRELQSGLAADVDPEIIVPMLVEFVVQNMAQSPELMRLLYVAGFELPGAERMFREHLGPIFDSVNAYFGRCAARGAIGDLEPTFATLGLAGAVSAHCNLHQAVYRPRFTVGWAGRGSGLCAVLVERSAAAGSGLGCDGPPGE